jgi:hypothetical protein
MNPSPSANRSAKASWFGSPQPESPVHVPAPGEFLAEVLEAQKRRRLIG